MKNILVKINSGTLKVPEVNEFAQMLLSSQINNEQKAAILAVLQLRKPGLSEIESMADYLLQQCIVPFQTSEPLLDVCGTGGDGKSTVNFSTLTAIIVAATGIKVCKHGNYGVTSINGSSNVLEYIGYSFKKESNHLLEELNSTNLTFLHAPYFHPVLKELAPLRKNLKIKTLFNVLGPMVNPLQPFYRFTGVADLSVARIYHYSYQKKNIKYNIIHSVDGQDEITLTSNIKLFSNNGEFLFTPNDFNSTYLNLSCLLSGHSIEKAAKLFIEILQNKSNPNLKHVVLTNSAMAYKLVNEQVDFKEAYLICEEALTSGKAYNNLKQLIK